MILISSTQTDPVTNKVMDWIHRLAPDRRIIRLNDGKGYQIRFQGQQIFLIVNNEWINFNDIQAYWYRRGRIRYQGAQTQLLSEVKLKEEALLEAYLEHQLSKKTFINQFSQSEPNKLIVLDLAAECGLTVPPTYLVETKSDLEKLMDTPILTKNLLASSMFQLNDCNATMYAQPIDNITETPPFFAPSLVQKNIKKKYELRVFFLHDTFWSMAIFSQNDTQTIADFRIYNQDKPNRTIPFNLPKSIELKLLHLMKRMNLNCGSIDLIVTPENEFVFLEVNPVGQFEMVSVPCNYQLEKAIAHYLIESR